MRRIAKIMSYTLKNTEKRTYISHYQVISIVDMESKLGSSRLGVGKRKKKKIK